MILLLLLLALRSLSIQEKSPLYTIDVRYPGPNRAALQLVQQEIRAFKQEAVEKGSRLEIRYRVLYQTEKITTVLFEGSSFTGGAHPNPIQIALLLDPQGNRISYDRYFQGDWLTALQDLCRRDLERQNVESETDWILTGTAAKPENYQLLLPTARGLLVIFPAYQIAPYSAGPQKVLLPYASLTPYLRP